MTGIDVRMHPVAGLDFGDAAVITTMTVIECFSQSYQEARRKFLGAARTRSGTVESFVHPSLHGPDGEDLATDVVSFARHASAPVLMIVSGTHGVEGYAGSGCQLHFLLSDWVVEFAESLSIVLVHAVNPFGFAYNRRTNESNIDLNRNFMDFTQPLPVNPDYLPHATEFLPRTGRLEDYRYTEARLAAEARERGGYQFLKKALQPGQYAHPEGLYYGGTAPAWSNTTFMTLCRQYLSETRRAAILDIHTGLGPHGIGELIFMSADSAKKHAHSFSPPVSCAGGAASVSAGVKGPLVTAACQQVRGDLAIGCALEFGTVSVEDNTRGMIFENWTHRFLHPDDELYRQSSRRLRDIYYCDTPSWKQSVIERSTEVIGQLRDRLLGPNS